MLEAGRCVGQGHCIAEQNPPAEGILFFMQLLDNWEMLHNIQISSFS